MLGGFDFSLLPDVASDSVDAPDINENAGFDPSFFAGFDTSLFGGPAFDESDDDDDPLNQVITDAARFGGFDPFALSGFDPGLFGDS